MSVQTRILRATGNTTREMRNVYSLKYKIEVGRKTYFIDEEAFSGDLGCVVVEMNEGRDGFALPRTRIEDNRIFMEDLGSKLKNGQYEIGQFTKIFDYEEDVG